MGIKDLWPWKTNLFNPIPTSLNKLWSQILNMYWEDPPPLYVFFVFIGKKFIQSMLFQRVRGGGNVWNNPCLPLNIHFKSFYWVGDDLSIENFNFRLHPCLHGFHLDFLKWSSGPSEINNDYFISEIDHQLMASCPVQFQPAKRLARPPVPNVAEKCAGAAARGLASARLENPWRTSTIM